MKKKGIIGIVLAVCLLLALASPALAAAPTVTNVSPGSGGVGVVPVTITGNNFLDPATVVVSGTGVTVGAVTVASATSITTTFIIAADAAPTARDVSVTVAGETGTGTGLFTVNPYITVGAPPAINLGYMTAGTTETGSSLTGSVTTNDDVWSVSAVDAKGTATGYMNTLENGSGTSLAAKFKIGKVAETLVDASTAITYTDGDTTPLVLELYVSQVVAADAVAGSYQITITFTGSN